jgi:hypothetical protein
MRYLATPLAWKFSVSHEEYYIHILSCSQIVDYMWYYYINESRIKIKFMEQKYLAKKIIKLL